MVVGDAYVFPGFLTPVLTQLFFPKPPTTFLTCFCRGERRKYARKISCRYRGSNSQPPGHESDTLTTEPPGRGLTKPKTKLVKEENAGFQQFHLSCQCLLLFQQCLLLFPQCHLFQNSVVKVQLYTKRQNFILVLFQSICRRQIKDGTKCRIFLNRVENIVGKKENAGMLGKCFPRLLSKGH